MVVLVCILVPRYFYLESLAESPSTPQTQQSGNAQTPTEPTIKAPESPSQEDSDYQNTYSNKLLCVIVEAGGGYALFAKYQNTDGNIDASKLNLNSTNITELETIAQPIYETIQTYKNSGEQITETFINSNNYLFSSITTFTNKLNELAET